MLLYLITFFFSFLLFLIYYYFFRRQSGINLFYNQELLMVNVWNKIWYLTDT